MSKSKVDELKEELYRATLELKRQQEETERQIEKTHKEIDKLSKEISKITGSWGLFVEGLVAPAVPKILRRFGFDIQRVYLNAKSKKGAETMEVDILGAGLLNSKENVVVLCSVKSRLQVSDVRDFLEQIPRFYSFFPEYKGNRIVGLVAGIRIDEGADKFAEKRGLYVLGSSGEAVMLLNKRGFKPRFFG